MDINEYKEKLLLGSWEELITEEMCIEWVSRNLPFLIISKKGKYQYPFKSAHAARVIEENLGKQLYKLLNK